MSETIDYLNVATTATVGVAIMTMLEPTTLVEHGLVVAMLLLAVFTVLGSYKADGGEE